MIIYKQGFALYAIMQGEVADSATVPALLELDPRSVTTRLNDVCQSHVLHTSTE